MCIAAAAIPAVSLAVSAVGTVASIGMGMMQASQQAAQAQASLNMQAQQAERQQQMQHQSMLQSQEQQRASLLQRQQQTQQNYNLQVAQSNQQIADQYAQQQRQVRQERANLMDRHAADKIAYQRSKEAADEQSRLNNEAANRVYMGEQAKIDEARTAAAFEAQEILAKSIGSKGTILASGRSGQSVGLLVQDVERQAGFAKAQELAMADKKVEQAEIAMEGAFNQNLSDNAAVASNVSWNPSAPSLPEMPGLPEFIDGSKFSIA